MTAIAIDARDPAVRDRSRPRGPPVHASARRSTLRIGRCSRRTASTASGASTWARSAASKSSCWRRASSPCSRAGPGASTIRWPSCWRRSPGGPIEAALVRAIRRQPALVTTLGTALIILDRFGWTSEEEHQRARIGARQPIRRVLRANALPTARSCLGHAASPVGPPARSTAPTALTTAARRTHPIYLAREDVYAITHTSCMRPTSGPGDRRRSSGRRGCGSRSTRASPGAWQRATSTSSRSCCSRS